MPAGLSLVEERANATLIITAVGELDAAGAPAFARRVRAAIGAGESDLLLDLSRVAFLDSTALGCCRRPSAASRALAGSFRSPARCRRC